ncbi:hypothetical protein [Mucilaginibacter sp.]|uniref:hypothetical protein n=1 Tax=Mucilaginibacter sp. TaxID=1882438 RepID=UPI0025EE105B|nr:hypothetical protein [Mucilaginibacter sp.]
MKETEITPEKLLSSILIDRFSSAVARMAQVQSIIAENFMLPEIDIPRIEACNCYVIGATTACITLTNHLLERYCKELLIQVEFGPPFMRTSFQFDNSPSPDLSVYLNKDLSRTLAALKSKDLLSKETWKILDKYRDIFRNGFAHYDPALILKGLTYKISVMKMPGEPIEEKELNLHQIPHVGLAVEAFAEKNAWLYLVTVENFIRSTIRHFHNPDIDPVFPMIVYP